MNRFIKISLTMVRAILLLIAIWQLLGILPVVTWFGNFSAVGIDHVATLTLKIVFFLVFSFAYIFLTRIQNKKHHKQDRSYQASSKCFEAGKAEAKDQSKLENLEKANRSNPESIREAYTPGLLKQTTPSFKTLSEKTQSIPIVDNINTKTTLRQTVPTQNLQSKESNSSNNHAMHNDSDLVFENEWDVLCKYEREFRDAINRLKPYGDKGIGELKRAYRVISDRSKISEITSIIIDDFEKDTKKKEIALQNIRQIKSPSSQQLIPLAEVLGYEINIKNHGFDLMRDGKKIKYFSTPWSMGEYIKNNTEL
ncbi:MAG: hypothetical protein H6998_19005 [Hahellaceae bacterium]|nr:hypothetical protein [Hahellaceae bacterium]